MKPLLKFKEISLKPSGETAFTLIRYVEYLSRSKKVYELTMDELRHRRENLVPSRWAAQRLMGSVPDNVTIEEKYIKVKGGEISALLLRPDVPGPLPLIVYYHGGGFVFGRPKHYSYYCSQLARDLGAAVLVPDYRLAPENKFPTQPEDAYQSLVWGHWKAREYGFDRERIAVMGDSAGGCLAAVVSLMARERKGPGICHQTLFYPMTSGMMDTASYSEITDSPALSAKGMAFFISKYQSSPEDIRDPYFSPLLAPSHENLPPCTLVTAGLDPLRDEGMAYAYKLEQSGVPVKREHYPDIFHAFHMFISALGEAEKCYELTIDELSKVFQPGS